MHTSKLRNCLTSIIIFQDHLVSWCKLEHTIGRPLDLSVGVIHAGCKEESLQRELKMTHIDFAM